MRIAVLLLSACLLVLTACSTDSITGSGNIVNEQRTVAEFSQIENTASIRVVVDHSATQKVVVEADDNIISHIQTNVVNGVLKIGVENGSYDNINVTIKLSMPTLTRILNSGSGDVACGSGFDVDDLDVANYGSGNISFVSLICNKLTSEQQGSGNFTFSGTVNTHNCKLSGSGDLNAFDCTTKQSAIAIYGSGDANVNVSERLFADILGSGNITYSGSPSIDQHITGSGKLIKKV